MPNKLLIRIVENQQAVEWLMMSVNNEIISKMQQSSISALPITTEITQIMVLLPGTQVLSMTTHIPKTSQSKLLKAIPYALEDHLATTIDDYHFILISQPTAEQQNSLVIANQYIQQIITNFEATSLVIDYLIPEYLALNSQPSHWHAIVTAEHFIVRCGANSGLSCDRHNANELMNLLLQQKQHEKPLKLTVNNCSDQPLNLTMTNDIDVAYHETPSAPLDIFAKQLTKRATYNLLRGKFLTKHGSQKIRRYWQWATASAAAVLVLFLMSFAVGEFFLKIEHAKLKKQIASIYFKTFPDAKEVIAPQVRFKRELRALEAHSDQSPFATILATIGQQLNLQPTIQLQKMQYRNQQLQLEITLDQFKTLETLTDALKATELNVQRSNVQTQGNIITAELIISRKM